MTLAPGITIGPYRIDRALGRGGMGEVHLAHDTRLDRHVAIKALPAHLTSDQDRLGRFQREAKVLASLNHSNIGAIYGLEESAGHQYLVLEYVEGETLADRLASGAIPVDESLSIAKQIAEALEAAHEKCVIHRDLKPGNVMVTPDGVVKVLDFGLARTADGTPSTSGAMAALDDSPTITSPARINSPTIPGVILGTAGYMSPEQARGKPVDKRSDIFSFGCVLYEMLTGIGPFPGETVTDSLGAILHREPDWSLLPPTSSSRIRELLERCMAKDRRNRLHDIADARLELERAIAEPRESVHTTGPLRPWWRSAGVLATVSLVALAVISLALLLRQTHERAPSENRLVRAGLFLPKGMRLMEDDRAVAVSPDGSQLVVALVQKDSTSPPSLFLRDLSRLEFRALAGTEEATYPFWSPDGKSIAFFAERKLKRLDLSDNIVRVLCEAPAGRGGSWSTKGTIVFAPSAGGGLMIVSDAGGSPTPITTVAAQSESHRLPQFLPDGERFLYYVQNSGVYAFDSGTKQSSLILPGPTEAVFVEPGFLVFARDENLMAQPFDPDRLTLSGSATPIAPSVMYVVARAFINAGVSPTGTLVYQPVARLARFSLGWMDSQGVQTPLPIESFPIGGGSLSQDARRVAVQVDGDRGESSLAVIDLDRGITTNIIDPKATFTYGAVMSRDGQQVFTSPVQDGKQRLVSYPSAGGAQTLLHEGEHGFEYGVGSITPDGQTLLFAKVPLLDKVGDMMTIGLDAPQSPRTLLQTTEPEWSPTISPNGDMVVYVVGREEGVSNLLKVVAYPNAGAPVQAAPTPVGFGFGWLGTDELYWMDMTRRMWSAVVSSKDGQLDVGAPKAMFEGRPLDAQTQIVAYDIPRKRFLIAIEDEPQEDARLIVVSDWRPESVGSGPVRK